MHIERNKELRRLYFGPHAQVYYAIVAHQPSQSHIDAFQSSVSQLSGQTLRIGVALIGGRKFALHQLHKAPRRSLAFAHMVSRSKVVQRAIAAKYSVKTAKHIFKVAGEESAMNIYVGESLISLVEDIVERLVLHYREHFFAIVANHFSFAPSDGSREKRHHLDVLQAFESARKLHRVVGDKIGVIDAKRLTVEKLFQTLKIAVVHCAEWNGLKFI